MRVHCKLPGLFKSMLFELKPMIIGKMSKMSKMFFYPNVTFLFRRPPSSEHLRRLQSGSPSHAPNGDGTAEESKYSEYTGPSAYQKPSGKSNRKIIQNAITYCCLSGGVNRDAKDKCLEV